jgi:hopene-associated glycosyltransferase HpnB
VTLVLAALAAVIWLVLLLAHGRFWSAGPELRQPDHPVATPAVGIVVPARDEAATIEPVLRSLLTQTYGGDLTVILVDDNSTDDTGAIARAIADPRLRIIDGQPRPPGWAGKLWAVSQGCDTLPEGIDYILLTDADITHGPNHLATLVAHATAQRLDMVSEMVSLHCESLAERALIPAFVYFFQLLYPFAWVNQPAGATAAAAGGTILIHRAALARIGGIGRIRGALIDDVALARAVKPGGPIWLGHTRQAHSIRPYPAAADIWRMIARSAYVQLNRSPLLLLGTVLGMILIWLIPIGCALLATPPAQFIGAATFAASAASFLPTLRRFGLSPLWALALPFTALFYLAATIGSAIDHHAGRGVVWKNRAYEATE